MARLGTVRVNRDRKSLGQAPGRFCTGEKIYATILNLGAVRTLSALLTILGDIANSNLTGIKWKARR